MRVFIREIIFIIFSTTHPQGVSAWLPYLGGEKVTGDEGKRGLAVKNAPSHKLVDSLAKDEDFSVAPGNSSSELWH